MEHCNEDRSPLAVDADLEERQKVSALLRPETYPEPGTHAIEVIQTHFAWIFLTDNHAYKMKKAMRAPGFDLTELDARHQNCLAELRLNRRLAPEVYLQVVPLSLDEDGTLRIAGRDHAIEWLVRMRRLPRELMLDAAMERGAVTMEAARSVAGLLAGLHGPTGRAT